MTDSGDPRARIRHVGFGLSFLVITAALVVAALIAAGVIDSGAVGVPLAIVGGVIAIGAGFLSNVESEGNPGLRIAQLRVFRLCLGAALIVTVLAILIGAVLATAVPFLVGAILTVVAYAAFIVLVRQAK